MTPIDVSETPLRMLDRHRLRQRTHRHAGSELVRCRAVEPSCASDPMSVRR